MDQVSSTPTPEVPSNISTPLIVKLEGMIRSNVGFEMDLKSFLGISDEVLKGTANIGNSLLAEVISRMKANPVFALELEKFMNFCSFGEEVKKKPVEEGQSNTRNGVKRMIKNDERESDDNDKKALIDNLIDSGYPLSAAGRYQVEISIKAGLQKPVFVGSTVRPRQIYLHLSKVKKEWKKSKLKMSEVKIKAAKCRMKCEPWSSSLDGDPSRIGIVLTKDGACLLIDPEKNIIYYDELK